MQISAIHKESGQFLGIEFRTISFILIMAMQRVLERRHGFH